MPGELLAVATLFIFAANAFLVRAASRRLEQGLGFLVGLVANIGSAGIAVVGQLILSGAPVRPPWTAIALFLSGGLLANYLGRRGYFRSVQDLGPARASAIQVTNPAFAVAFAWGLLRETISAVDLLAIAAVLVGLLLTSHRPGHDLTDDLTGRRVQWKHFAPAILAAASYGLGNVVRGAAVRQWEEPLFGGLLGALSGTLVYALLHVSVRDVVRQVRAADRIGLVMWWGVGTLAIVGQMFVIAATARIPVGVAVAISSALPIVVIPISLLVLRNRERLTVWSTTGAGLIVAGVAVMVLM